MPLITRILPAWLPIASLTTATHLWAATPVVLHSFDGNSGGANPRTSLVASSDGTFYGATANGGYAPGALGSGTIFRVTASGSLITLYTFPKTGYNGAGPNSLVLGKDGNLYGTTEGSVFEVSISGKLTMLHSFTGGADGANPGSLAAGSDGNLYGTTGTGGSHGYGTVFKITTGGTLTTLHAFTGASDGASPQAALVQGGDGNFYGTTCYGGTATGYAGYGTVFKVTAAGALTTLYSFKGAADGSYPFAALTFGGDGNLYGSTSTSASGSNRGTLFQTSTGGTFKTLYAFTGKADGDGPVAGLTLAGDGLLYGTTHTGGYNSSKALADGTLFSLTTSGTLTTIYTFTGGSTGASNPGAALAVGADGNLYGTTVNGGTNSSGAMFQQAVTNSSANKPGTLQFSSSTYSAKETAGTATITVTRLSGSTGAVSVKYAAAAGTGTIGTDFKAQSGTLTWTNGDSGSRSFTIPVLDDTASTADHTVLLTLSSPTGGASLGTQAGATLTILDAASAAATPTVNLYAGGDGTFSTGTGKGKLIFTRSGGDTSGALTVYYKIKGSAGNGTDYVGPDGAKLSGTAVIPAGSTRFKLKLKALVDPPKNEKVKITLESDPAGLYQLGTSIKAVLKLE